MLFRNCVIQLKEFVFQFKIYNAQYTVHSHSSIWFFLFCFGKFSFFANCGSIGNTYAKHQLSWSLLLLLLLSNECRKLATKRRKKVNCIEWKRDEAKIKMRSNPTTENEMQFVLHAWIFSFFFHSLNLNPELRELWINSSKKKTHTIYD